MVEVELVEGAGDPHYVATVDGRRAGLLELTRAGKRVVYTHTEVDPAFEGQGVGSALVRRALDDLRGEDGSEAVPVCPFVASWIKRHPDYAGLVTPALRPQFERAG